MVSRNKFLISVITLILWLGIYSCSKLYVKHEFRKNYQNINEVVHSDIPDSTFFKIHLKTGEVGLLSNWDIDKNEDQLKGQGKLFDFNRNQINEGELSFQIEDIAIIETNQLELIKAKDKQKVAALSILTAINVIGDVICITNPKACFGSCPTFYLNGVSIQNSAHAEGFSSSISPSMEMEDLDALQFSTSSKTLGITMKNEAYETHMVNELLLQAVPKYSADHIFHDKNKVFFKCDKLISPVKAMVNNESILPEIKSINNLEYYSKTDSLDLASKEEIYLEFNDVPFQNSGLVINFRQTLLTTFLLYNGISYMGNEVGDYFAKIETNANIKKRISNPFKQLGQINLYYWNNNSQKWILFEELYETGPIAKNLMIAPMGAIQTDDNTLKIKVELTKGLWRLDYMGLASIEKKVTPLSLYPTRMTTNNSSYYEQAKIMHDDNDYLITFPGDEFNFEFDLPPLPKEMVYELFLMSKGYYLEWVRKDWIKNKNLTKLKKMLLNDDKTWIDLAKEYKSIEGSMEGVFWNSKYINY